MEIEILKMILQENNKILNKVMDEVDGVGLSEIDYLRKQIANNEAGMVILEAI